MQQQTKRRGFGWGYFIVGLLFIIAALFAFASPAAGLEAITYIFAALAIVNGLWLIFSNMSSVLRVVGGVLNLLLGIFMFANIYLAMLALPYVFAIWFIINSVFELINASSARELGNGFYWFTIIINIIGILVGIMMLFAPVVAMFTVALMVGFYLALIGVECVVLAFARMRIGEATTIAAPEEDLSFHIKNP